jgi:hypothetical protein
MLGKKMILPSLGTKFSLKTKKKGGDLSTEALEITIKMPYYFNSRFKM